MGQEECLSLLNTMDPEPLVPDPIITNYPTACSKCYKPVRCRVHEGSDAIEKRGKICVSVRMHFDYTCDSRLHAHLYAAVYE